MKEWNVFIRKSRKRETIQGKGTCEIFKEGGENLMKVQYYSIFAYNSFFSTLTSYMSQDMVLEKIQIGTAV